MMTAPVLSLWLALDPVEHSACLDDLLWSGDVRLVIEDAGDAFGVERTDDNAIATKFEAAGRMILQTEFDA